MTNAIQILSEAHASLTSLHDCHAYGISWKRDAFQFVIHLQYITRWTQPENSPDAPYRFHVSDARLEFSNVHDPRVSLDWSKAAIDAQISAARITDSSVTSTGAVVRHFELDFSVPDASIDLWSTGYQIVLLSETVVSETPFAASLGSI